MRRKKITKEQKEYLKKWDEFSDEDINNQLDKWSDFLWLGRHLYLKSIEKVNIKDHKEAFEYEEEIINRYKNDIDFLRCMVFPQSENGDEEWEEILNNVGSLTYLSYGKWDLSS